MSFLLAATVQNFKEPWRFVTLGGHHPPGGAYRLPEIAHDCVSSVRVKVAANQAAAKPNAPAHLSRIKTNLTAQRQPKDLLFQRHRPIAELDCGSNSSFAAFRYPSQRLRRL
jgi:hypothetical protein